MKTSVEIRLPSQAYPGRVTIFCLPLLPNTHAIA